MLTVTLLPKAKSDIKNAAIWYNNHQKGLGKIFTNQVRNKIKYCQKHPKTIAIRYDETRTALVPEFPYMIHFIIEELNKNIVIIAVIHTSRNPKF